MTLQETLDKKYQLEQEVEQLLKKFREDTGLNKVSLFAQAQVLSTSLTGKEYIQDKAVLEVHL